MKIRTTRFGTIEKEEEKIINMPFGMLGFQDRRQFVILQHREHSPFFWYQSVEDPALAFVLTSPFLFISDYKVDVDAVLKEMSWEGDGEDSTLELYIVVNIPEGIPEKMTGNFIGPILFNRKERQAVQMVIPNSPYSHKYPLIEKTRRKNPATGP